MLTEVRALTETYLDGAGILAYRPNSTNDGYEHVQIPWPDRIVELDDVVHGIASEINGLERPHGRPPEPQIPTRRAVDVTDLDPDDEQVD
ncbi:hypothetical protein [Jiangella alkaliphila]|nr:hypothetical protein [Jiangella alkaliphila]